MRADRTVLVLALTLSLAASSGLRAQDPRGSEIRVSQATEGGQWTPDVAIAPDGRFVVVWEDHGGPDFSTLAVVMARLFDATGRPRSKDIQVARVAPGAGPAVSMAPDGRFVVVWGGNNDNVVSGRRFAADGRPLGPRFRLAKSPELIQFWPDVAMAPDGSFVAVWSQDDGGSEIEAPYTTDVMLRRFTADGRPLGPETVAIGGYEEQSAPQVAITPNGGFVIACESYDGRDGAFYGVWARLFSRSGTPLGDEFLVNEEPNASEASQYEPAVAVAADGRFAVAWTDGPDAADVFVRFYATDGTPQSQQLQVNTFQLGKQDHPAISALQSGGFLVTWQSGAGQDGDREGIFARAYGPKGQPLGREFRINLNRMGTQYQPAVTIAPNGRGAAVWSGPDGDGLGVFARLIGAPHKGDS